MSQFPGGTPPVDAGAAKIDPCSASALRLGKAGNAYTVVHDRSTNTLYAAPLAPAVGRSNAPFDAGGAAGSTACNMTPIVHDPGGPAGSGHQQLVRRNGLNPDNCVGMSVQKGPAGQFSYACQSNLNITHGGSRDLDSSTCEALAKMMNHAVSGGSTKGP